MPVTDSDGNCYISRFLLMYLHIQTYKNFKYIPHGSTLAVFSNHCYKGTVFLEFVVERMSILQYSGFYRRHQPNYHFNLFPPSVSIFLFSPSLSFCLQVLFTLTHCFLFSLLGYIVSNSLALHFRCNFYFFIVLMPFIFLNQENVL